MALRICSKRRKQNEPEVPLLGEFAKEGLSLHNDSL